MANDRLFVAQVVLAIEEQWFAPGTAGPPIRTERHYALDAMLFAAADEQQAYSTVSDWLANEGFSDAHHDGPGDLTRIFAIGIHQLEEIGRLNELPTAVHEEYGISLSGFYLDDVDASGAPIVRNKEDLEVFRLLRMSGG